MAFETLRCGLLGRTLGHSYSPAIHKELAGYSYRLFEVEPEQLGSFTVLQIAGKLRRAEQINGLWDDEEDSEKSELGDANAGEESAIPTEKVELDMTAASPEP